ncbi:IgGFc-binding protein-like [Salvelinus namaycush]|uniref:IgGFc-binding protein-like n=1 Tax=Salvelinus namaycush TaxID=8040 RepID=A0A8U0PWP7_SALNM|nr:IgGFc-binding protein-like [Salvelinus namaycush]
MLGKGIEQKYVVVDVWLRGWVLVLENYYNPCQILDLEVLERVESHGRIGLDSRGRYEVHSSMEVRPNSTLTIIAEMRLDLNQSFTRSLTLHPLPVVSGSCPVGREFITAFMPNYLLSYHDDQSLQLAITTQDYPAIVQIQVNAIAFSTSVKIEKQNTKWIAIPGTAEIGGPGASTKTVQVTSNSDISVVAFNYKFSTGDSSVVFPTDQLGTDYVVFTPDEGPSNMHKLMSIVNGKEPNKITIIPVSNMNLSGLDSWKQRKAVIVTMEPYQVYLYQSYTSFTGTRVKAKLPVAVLGGHECIADGGRCNHVYEQLLPVQSLSTNYLVPSMHMTQSTDFVNIVASEDNTLVKIFEGKVSTAKELNEGQAYVVSVQPKYPLIIKSDKKVMVMYFSNNKPYDPFLTNILPTSDLANEWSVDTQSKFESTLVIVSEGEGIKTVKVCTAPPTPPPDPCENVKCREKEECTKGVCVAQSKATCRAVGDPHYLTFDGERFDFQGTCSYVMATVVKSEPGLIPFTVLTKNNHRGNKRVSFVRKVSVTVYGLTVVISTHKGKVEVNGENVYLPVTLAGGNLTVVYSGSYAVLKTNFGLKVMYDWNMKFYITVPSSYFRTLGGLCGNYNGDRNDEFTNPKGNKEPTVVKFAQSWRTEDGDLFCHDDCQGECPSCTPALQQKYKGEKLCGLLAKKDGPFASCHKVLDPGMFMDNCVYDVCINKGIYQFLCENMKSYNDACLAEGVKISPEWRTITGCYLDAEAKCKEPCVETCQCNKGFVLSGDKCVSKESCGCSYEGRYYPSGMKFWEDDKCTKQCECNPGTAKVECKATACKKSEMCGLQSGKRDCYPTSYATCQGSGDPHYRTFDGKRFDFQGTCTYVLSKLVSKDDKSLAPFEVLVKNQNRGRNTAVSYTKTVTIIVFKNIITMSRDNPGKVLVNNQYVNLPFDVEDGQLSIFRSGYFGVVKTKFGLTLKFNWNSHVSLTLPSSYSDLIGGLCGNWNGQRNDDLLKPDKSPANTPTVFGDSWKVGNDPGCSSDCDGKKCPTCDHSLMLDYQTGKYCGRITDKNGPFKHCHAKVDPTEYYEDCVFDMCLYRGHASALCNALSTYTTACQDAPAKVEQWRSDSFCPSSCKANSHYEVCASGCPQTCSGLGEPESCENSLCTEGCVCDDGFIQSDSECVPLAECGCIHQSQYYLMGQVFFPNGQCKERCVCKKDGHMECNVKFACGPNEKCQVQDGVQACIPMSTGTCHVSGARRFHSFDGSCFSLHGDCVYKMSEVVEKDGSMAPFVVSVQQLTKIDDAMVDDVATNLPLSLGDGKVRAYQNGINIIVVTDFGLMVTYDTVAGAIIQLPSTYKGVTGGLCGNYNDKKEDDFLLPSGLQEPSVEKFAAGWLVVQEGVKCQTGCDGGLKCPPTSGPPPACSIIKSTKGPFAQCHAVVPPHEHFEECMKEGEALTCPANSHYELCADTCSSTCGSLSESPKCPLCQEGCQCDDGFVFDGGKCVLLENCGCGVDGHYYKSGQSVMLGNCSETCSCAAGVFTCKNSQCKEGQKCGLKNGVMDCYSTDPCEGTVCREKENCVVKNNKAVCVAQSKATCRAVGDPHYLTFDGERFDFQGTCSYVMATVVKSEPGLIPFTVLTKNNHRGNRRVSFVRKVSVTVYGLTVVISTHKGKVEVNGENVYLPVTLAGGNLTVVYSGSYAVLKTNFGLKVMYDWNMKFYITVPSSYFRTLGGLCGNYNGDRNDEFTNPKGNKEPTVVKFAQSWRTEDGDLFCHDDCQGECPSCTPALQQKYKGEKLCGLLAKKDGPFASCHKVLDPGMFMDNCVYDVCINKGIYQFLCENMKSYNDACLAEGVKISPEWRTITGCYLDAEAKCKEPCVETCQCNKGFVLSGDKCVSKESCGCSYEGRYYPSGMKFWEDDKCTKQCECNPGTAKVECKATACKKSEMCGLQSGKRDCYPTSYATCQGSGDPHYRTFDGKRFDFQGTCTYVLSKLVSKDDKSLAPFEVLVKNQNRGRNTAVSYTKTVTIIVFKNIITMSRDNPGKVLFNNQYVNLPFDVEDGQLSIFRSGYFGVVKTKFGLTLKFNWNSHVSLTLPSSYSDLIGGLCGNWNGQRNDDLLKPDKSPANTPTVFGDSWKVGNDPGCSSDCDGKKCPTCDHSLMLDYQTGKYCGRITDKNGPFKHCHAKVDPTEYYEDCVFDMCLYRGHASALCNALSTYTTACQDAPAKVEQWRSDSFCPSSCKANSHYEVCASGCPQTCSGLGEPESCENSLCTEGCVCDEGFIQSDSECVPLAECGCIHQGQYYLMGQVFFPNGQCKERCVCNKDGHMECNVKFACGPNEKCQVQDGVQACIPMSTGTCHVSGARRFHSFDGSCFSLHGDCVYKMSEVVEKDGSMAPFVVSVQQLTKMDDAMVDDVATNLPLSLGDGKVRAYQNGINIIVVTDFGLMVTYDTVAGAIIQLPSTYKGVTGGLCGNYNDKKEDDFLLPSGLQEPSVEKFAVGWLVVQEGVKCQTGCDGGLKCPPTSGPPPACSIIKSTKGPFAQCHAVVPPQEHFEECMKEGEALTCPANSHYELCADTCSSTCGSLSESPKCPLCQEGCQCDDGFVFDGGKCVLLENCGCGVDGHYYKSGQSVMLGNCSETCSCAAGVFTCKNSQCKEGQKCGLKNGVMDCYSTDPCEGTVCREKENCVVKNNKAVCVAQSKATCRAVGDPHYLTFDGERFDFQGTCSYVMATVVKSEPGLIPFTVLTKNNHRGNRRVSFVRKVSVTVYGLTVVISTHKGKVEVNGENVYLPVTLAGGNLTVVYSGSYAVLKTNFGLKVMYDWNMKFYITVPSSYFRTLGGLCGNYNGDRNDEFTNPKGNKEPTVVKFAQSWRTEDGDLFCHDDCQGECPSCTPALQQKYKGEKLCGLLAKKDGPFASCHKVLDPGMFMDNCVYDVCINKGIYQFLCENMKSYNDACLAEGVKISPEWRTITGCYLDAEAKCKEPCVETCQCNKGFVLSGDKCVSKESCGCSYEGRYYPSGMKFWEDDKCTKQCECNPGTAKVECKATACKKSEMCGLQSGKRDCYPTSYATCQGSGDPHYRTFDGKRFDFQGTCTYVLSKLVSKDDKSLAPFEVLVKNQNRGRNTAVSYTKTVTIIVFKNIITMSRDNPGKVLFNNQYVNLPFDVEDGQLSIFRSGYFGVVKTKFGLTLKFNWNSHVSLTLPSSYSDLIGGLCGNWNGQRNDDLLKPDKSPANTPTVFGDSWKVGNDPGCSSDCDGKKCPTCDHSLMLDYQTGKYCGRITDKNGPFKHCHAKVDPTEYYEDCVFDMCLYRGHASALCNALSTYTTACQDAPAKVEQWRSDSFCPSSCKANSHYEVCASGCPQTCSGLGEPESCENSLCTEGCVCDEGFIQSDSECVPLAECGCIHQGQYYLMGQVFFPNGQCKERCVCKKDGHMECNVKFACGPNEKCQVQDGVQACIPMSTGTCHVSGARRFHSFDGSCFSLHGDCVYKMSEVVEKDGSMAPFVVSVQQLTKMDDAMVDDVATNLPLSLGDGKVRAYQNGINIIVVTDFGLMVTYDTVAGAIIQLPSTYKGVTGGLCGNYNDKKEDDFLLPSGLQEPSVEKFAVGWLVVQEGVKCQTGCDGGLKCPPTSGPPPACSIIKSTKGPFAQCHAVVPPQEHFEECMKEGEALTCPANSHYELCADTCSSTCGSLSESPKCPLCQEGCQCDDGFVFDGGKCVLLENCGCGVDGHYYKSGQSVMLGNCSETCSCAAGVFTCKNSQCKEGQKCGLKNGVMDCYSTDPCEGTVCREKENCVVKNNKAVCVAQSKATCRAVGDPHYLTFDGERFDFQGTCSYVMATVVKSEPGLIPFTVLTKNNHRGNRRVSFVRKVSVTVYGLTVVISTHKGKVEVNGENVYLPVTLAGGNLTVVYSGSYAVLKTNFGLKVMYDWNMKFYITVPSSYFRTLGGLCGNYNGDRNDEFTNPKGNKEPTVVKFAQSWRTEDGDLFCHDDCQGECPSCTPALQQKYKGEKLCGLLAKKDGPFASCHKVLDPGMFMDNCVYDVCINKGIYQFLCENMKSYNDACLAEGVKISPEWRTITGCYLDAEAKCKEPCVETCQCNKGFVLSGDKCVSKESCGCSYEGRYYPSGMKFWEDDKCTKQCECNPGTAKVECKATACKKSEMCGLQSGKRDCYPTSYATCQGSGDPHYRTFDGKRFDFQGTCTYVLSKLVSKDDKSLAPFEVLVKNQNRGRNTAVSYTKTVTIIVFKNIITMSRDNPGKVLFNNQYVNLPFDVEDGQLSIFRSGYFGVVKTKFGLTLKFNWNSHVSLTLPSSYSDLIGGLCGNWNGQRNDDLLKPDKSPANTPTVFGDSWKVGNDPGCSSDCDGKKCPTCDHSLMLDYQTGKYCGRITDKNGPFKHCHAKVDPTEYYEDCVFDMCLYRGHASALCNALSTYTTACQDAPAKVEQWRSDSFCPSSCKANSHYEVCASGCPQTCSGLGEPESCENSLCTEGCVCDEGFIQSDSECVPLAECGCIHQGQYYLMGQVFFPNGQCKERCVCKKDGHMECNVKFACGPNEKCQVQDGVQACIPMSTGTCHVSGARRFHSFDGSCFSLHGDCVYKMSEVVEKDGSMAPFVVSVQQLTKMDDAMVDDVATNLPLSLGDGKVRAYQNGINIIVVTDFGLMVTYDTVAGAIIQLPSTYKGVTGGLCGNYNDKKEDDFLLPSGLQEPSVEKFAVGWLVVQEGVKCQTGCDGGLKCPPTSGPPPACSIIKSTKGPFAQCHAVVPPQEHFEECMKEGEALTCPANSHYELCADTCSSTCGSLSESPKCPLCQEGCQCDDGFVFDGGKCVLLENCGCGVDGHYYKSGQSVMLGNCSETCSCAAGVFTCKNSQCKEGQKCGLKNGVMDCYSTDPCEGTECRDKENCVVKNNKAVCVAQSKAYCWAFGDPHYTTFDGQPFSFTGTCSYILVNTTGKDPSLPQFSIQTKNELRGNSEGSFVKSANIDLSGHRITILSGQRGTVEIDGIRSDLPVSLESGSIRITESGIRGTIQSDVGLEITFDWTSLFMVTISSSYYDNLGGICGNYNGNKADDFTTPTGVLSANTTAWVASWSVADGDPFCWHVCNSNCPTCSDADRALYTGPQYCGLMTDVGGPFEQCHKKVPVKEFASNCLYDVCLNEGRQEVLCEALANYVAECQQAGAVVSPLWRKASNCPLACPYHSHYELCGTACPATCADLKVSEICSKVCVEGCQCDKGYVLSGEQCVVKETGCGCTHNDHYYLPEETFWEGNTCQSKCVCDGATQKVMCMPRKCKASEHCAVVNGVQDCYPLSFKTCSAQGDPHFRTFDGKRFDFQGNCIYKLAGVCSKDPDLENFEVTLENNNRGSTRVSYAKVVTVIVLGSSYTITGDYHGKVLVNDVLTSLPYYSNNTEVQIYRNRRFAVLETHFGLTVSFDWSGEVRVKVPSTYHNAICGLCGNLNDNPDDDLLLPNGKKPMSPKEFGNSYWVADVPGCSHECKDCAVVDIPLIKPKYVSACDVIVDKSGPLRDCIGRVQSDEYKEDCIYDMILNNGLLTAACDIITNYVEECQEKGGKIGAWRSKDFCHLPCPENSVYSLSASGCPATCYSMTSAPGCTTPPGEGCQCKPGFLLSDDKCVHVKNCGCHHKGRYFVSGEVFYKEENCHHRCSCNSGEMACEVAPCGPKTTCAVVKGVVG